MLFDRLSGGDEPALKPSENPSVGSSEVARDAPPPAPPAPAAAATRNIDSLSSARGGAAGGSACVPGPAVTTLGGTRERSARAAQRRFAVVLAAVAVLALGGVLATTRRTPETKSSTVPVEQPPTPGVAPRISYSSQGARRYHAVLHDLNPAVFLSFDAGTERPRVRHATLASAGLFGGSTDRAVVGSRAAAPATIAPVSALVGSASRTVVIWLRTGVRAQQTLFDVGRSSTATRMLLSLTVPASVPQAPDRREGLDLVLFDSDVFVPGLDLADDRWHQIAVSLERGEAMVMIDGEVPRAFVWDGTKYAGPVVQPVRLPAAPATAETRVSLGGVGARILTPTWRRGLRGRLDELAIFDRALPPTAITTLWHAAGGRSP